VFTLCHDVRFIKSRCCCDVFSARGKTRPIFSQRAFQGSESKCFLARSSDRAIGPVPEVILMPQSTATLEIEPNQVNPATDPQPGDAAAAAVSSTAASEPPAGCPQCGNLESWGRSSWCPECGYYPRLGTSIGRASGEGSQAAACAAPKSPREVWEQMPVWMKILCGGILAIVAESILVRAATADASLVRSVWGVLQLVMGFGVFAMFHAIAAMSAPGLRQTSPRCIPLLLLRSRIKLRSKLPGCHPPIR